MARTALPGEHKPPNPDRGGPPPPRAAGDTTKTATLTMSRRFSNSIWVISVRAIGQDRTILWEESETGEPFVRHIAEMTSI